MIKLNMVVYAFFLLSGVIKSFMYVNFITIDITLLSGLYCVACIAYSVAMRREIYLGDVLFPLFVLLVLYLWLSFSLMRSASSGYAYKKYFLSYLNLVAFCFPIFCHFCIKTFVRTVVFVTAILLVIFFVFKLTFSYALLVEYNLKSLYLAFGVLLGFSLIFMRTIEFRFHLFLFYFLFVGLVVSSARGPMVFYLLSVWLVGVFFRKSQLTNRFKAVYLFVPFVLMLFMVGVPPVREFVLVLVHDSFVRFSAFFAPKGGESVSGRLELYRHAINMLSENIWLGNGLGSFGLYVTGDDVRLYPHNLILELWSEMGIFSIGIVFVFVVSLLGRVLRNGLVMLVSLYVFLNVMKSNSFEELRMFFGFLSVSIIYARNVSVEYFKMGSHEVVPYGYGRRGG